MPTNPRACTKTLISGRLPKTADENCTKRFYSKPRRIGWRAFPRLECTGYGRPAAGADLKDTTAMPPPKQRPTGMVGKQELLRWVSEMCGRPVSSFSELKDGNALVTCVKETWPNAYDACRVSYPKRGGKDGGTPERDQNSN